MSPGHWIFGLRAGPWVGTRKNNGNMYESRTVLAKDLREARVFNTKSAATRAGNDCGAKGEAIAVTILIEGTP